MLFLPPEISFSTFPWRVFTDPQSQVKVGALSQGTPFTCDQGRCSTLSSSGDRGPHEGGSTFLLLVAARPGPGRGLAVRVYCVGHGHSLPLDVASHSPSVTFVAIVHTARLELEGPQAQGRVLGMHTSSGPPTASPAPPGVLASWGSSLSLSTPSCFPKPQPNLRPQTQTPKQQLQLRALPTQACAYPRAVGKQLLPERPARTAGSPWGLSEQLPQESGLPPQGRGHWGSHVHVVHTFIASLI